MRVVTQTLYNKCSSLLDVPAPGAVYVREETQAVQLLLVSCEVITGVVAD